MGKDKELLEEQLARVEDHIAKAKRHCERQRQIAEELERDGHNRLASEAWSFLVRFEEFHAQFITERERIKAELEKMNTYR
jgi:hypothetical protein